MPDLAAVTGTVTLDDAPLPKVVVTFLSAKGVTATGVTDDAGRYALLYRGTHRGAGLGANTVTVTSVPENPDAGVGKETLPAIYNARSTLTADVVAGGNTIDFRLESNPPGRKP